MPFNFPSFGRRTSSNNTFQTPTSSEPATPIPQTQTRRGLLQKQKATLHWAERFCWIEAGEFRWAEPSRDDSRMRGRERGGVNCADIHEARRITGDAERPHQFSVRTARGTVKFAASTLADAAGWVAALKPRRDVALLRERCWQFPARLVRSEEVVVTATASGGVVLSKYVGRGGFRLRIDGIGDATPEEIHVAPGTLKALGLANDDDTDPLCVVAAGSAPWSRAEHDAGSCLLALGPDGRREWKAMVEDVVAAEAPCKGESHPFLAVRRRRPVFPRGGLVDGVMARRWRHGGRARVSRHRRDAERGDRATRNAGLALRARRRRALRRGLRRAERIEAARGLVADDGVSRES